MSCLISLQSVLTGARDGNRTRITSLGSWCSATELHVRDDILTQSLYFVKYAIIKKSGVIA